MSGEGSLKLSWAGANAELRTSSLRLASGSALLYQPLVASYQPPVGPVAGEDEAEETFTFSVAGESYTTDSFDKAVGMVARTVAKALLGDCDHLLFHGGAVTNGEHTVIILGPSGAGKSTTTLEFVRRGYRFMAEEFTAIHADSDGGGATVYPFPRSFALKQDVLPLPQGDCLEIRKLKLFMPSEPISMEPHPVTDLRVIFPRYKPEGPKSIRTLSTGELCTQLVQSTFNFATHEKRLWPLLSALAVQATACAFEYQDVRRDLDDALRHLGID